MTAMTDADAWERLGAALIQRRTALHPRFHNRGAFCEATGLKYRLVYDIEEHRRTNFGASTLAAIEAAYRLAPGAIGRFLAGGELEVQDAEPRLASAVPPPADDLAEVRVLLAGLDRAKITARPEFDRVMKMVREFPDGVTIPGVFLYGDPRYQRAWDDLAGKEYSPGRAYTPPRMALVIAVQQWRDEREAAKREGKRDGGMAAGLSRAP